MPRRSTPFTQADITRLIKGAKAAGIGEDRIAGIELTKDRARLLFGNATPEQSAPSNEWDEVLSK